MKPDLRDKFKALYIINCGNVSASVGMKLHFHILPSTDGNGQLP